MGMKRGSLVPKWAKGYFSKELSQVQLSDAIGKNIICDDGVTRRCEEIVGSMKWPWRAIINEQDPESNLGHFVNMLSLTAQILGQPLPSLDAIIAFERQMKVRFGIQDDGSSNPLTN